LAEPRTVVITGSTSGIGRGIALHLARAHYQIVLNYSTDDEKAQETLRLCQQETAQVILVKADVSKKPEVERLMRACIEQFHTLDVLINNAARVRDKPVLEMTEEDWDEVVDTNMKGPFLCSQVAATYMLQQTTGGIILNIGASTGIKGRMNGINTCASKAGVMVMTKCLALELGPKVRVNTIIPGLTLTEETAERYQLSDPAVLRTKAESIPLQRVTTPEDIAHAVGFLLSEGAAFINGSKVVVDGGQYMW
jgi:NAD(P)-dependent dehydrogenase (short-subunit alcohol dehydrogenase family)